MKVQFESQKLAAGERSSALVMAVVIPVYNERENINAIVSAVAQALSRIDFEVVFVDDDSNDGTRDQIILIAKQDSRVRLIHRIGRRGLSTAVIRNGIGMAERIGKCRVSNVVKAGGGYGRDSG